MTSSLHISSVRLSVANLARSVRFYTEQVGFVARQLAPSAVALAVTPDRESILVLEAASPATPAPRDAAGLFHAALLLPSSAALGGWLHHAASHGVEFDGFSDHGVSQAIYFSDPDGNGLEFYADRPRDEWPYANGELAMTTHPLALQRLLAEASPAGDQPLAGAAWGHLHLRVTDLERSEAFYRETLGLAVMQRSFPGARFLAADDYHHHLGLNVWGHPRRPHSADTLGLAGVTFAHVGTTTTRSLVDPDGISLQVVPLGVLAES